MIDRDPICIFYTYAVEKKIKSLHTKSNRQITNKVDFRSAICWVNYDPMVSFAAVHLISQNKI